MKTSTMEQLIFDLIENLDADGLLDLYNHVFPDENLTIGEVEIDE